TEDSEPEFIVAPAPAAVENPAAAEPGNGDTASQQTNLFGFDPVAAPRRSRHRMISLYDDDLFERIPVRKADKPAASDDDPQFEVVAPPAHEPTPQPDPEETDIIVEISPNDSEMPQAPKAGDSGRIAEFIVDDGPQTMSGAESFRSGAPAAPAEPAKVVLGDVLGSDRRTLGESMADSRATTADALAHTPVRNLSGALSIGDRYRIESELFGGDAELCRRTLEKLDGMESLDDAVIYIEEHFSWHPSSEAACMIMELLERKFS
ncbi:MAG: hypothetical protein K2J33_05740, partial [Alistipes sp.]|nr:hypothetical protein [Alistipes sp.]